MARSDLKRGDAAGSEELKERNPREEALLIEASRNVSREPRSSNDEPHSRGNKNKDP